MRDEKDTPLTEEELALARKGEELIAAAVADVRAPQSLREAIERDRERARGRGRHSGAATAGAWPRPARRPRRWWSSRSRSRRGASKPGRR